MKFFLKTILWLAAVACTLVLTLSFVKGYTAFMSFFISLMHEQARAEKILSLLSETKFFLLQVILLVSVVVIAVLLLRFNRIWEFIRRSINAVRESLTHVFKDAGREALWILILPIPAYIFFAFYLPITYDEAATYIFFTSRSPLVSMLYYPAYNNHILHSVITNFTRYLPFLHQLQCIRISSIAASILTCIALFSLARKSYSLNTALFITGISSVLVMYIYYSFVSRGYALIHLFFVLCLYCVYKIVLSENRLRYWIYFSLFSILGFYTMPSFLYPFMTLNLVLLLSNYKLLPRLILFGCITAVITAALYTPIIIINGLETIAGSKKAAQTSLAEIMNVFPGFASSSLFEITGMTPGIIFIFLSAALVALVIQKRKFEIILLVAFVVSPLLIILLHPLIPFARTFSYYSIALTLLCVVPLRKYLDKIPVRVVAAAVILAQLLFLYSYYEKIKMYKKENLQYAEINKIIAGNNSYFMNCLLCDASLMFELKTRNFNEAIIKFNNPQVKVNADTINNYNFILIDKKYDVTKSRRPLYSDKETNVYAR